MSVSSSYVKTERKLPSIFSRMLAKNLENNHFCMKFESNYGIGKDCGRLLIFQ